MQPNPPSSGSPVQHGDERSFAFFRDRPGWTSVGVLVGVTAVGVAIAHDLFGFTFTKESIAAPVSNAPASSGAAPPGPSLSAGLPAAPTEGIIPSANRTASAKPCLRQVEITEPADGVQVRGARGVQLRGTVCGLQPGDTGWVFDFDPFDGYYYSGDAPAFVRNGGWAYQNAPVGDAGDNNKYYRVQVVLASAECTGFLAEFPVDDEGDKRLSRSEFPDTCLFADAVNVSVTWPAATP